MARGQPKGSTGNPTGRPKGTQNKITTRVKNLIADAFDNNMEQIQEDIENLDSIDRLKFFVALLPYVVPRKPIETTIQVSSPSVKVEGISTAELAKTLGQSIPDAEIIEDED